MDITNAVGLKVKETEYLAEKLNVLLSNYSVFYQNVRGYHWNVRGSHFFELHLKFEELYNSLFLKIDEIAERILTLGHSPLHCYSRYLNISEVQESLRVSSGTEAVREILVALKSLILLEREILETSEKMKDEGTNSLMSDYIREQEKLSWMYTAFLG